MEKITLTKDELVYIFAEWAAQHQAEPEKFYDLYEGYGPEDSAEFFLKLLEQRRAEVADTE